VYSSSDHVIRGGPKYTISLPSDRGMSVDKNPFLDWRYLIPFWSSGPAKSEIVRKLTKIGGFRAPKFYWGGRPPNFGPTL